MTLPTPPPRLYSKHTFDIGGMIFILQGLKSEILMTNVSRKNIMGYISKRKPICNNIGHPLRQFFNLMGGPLNSNYRLFVIINFYFSVQDTQVFKS